MNEIKISNIQPQEIIIDEGGATGITTVYVNGVDVTQGSVAYVVVPTKLSELQNDEHFITQETDPTVPYYIKTITLADINSWNNKQDRLVSGSNIKTINNQSILGNGNINVSTEYTAGTGINITNENVINNTITSYNDLNDLPTIPSKTSELLNDSDFVTSDELSNVAFSGSYADLSNTPDLSLYATLDTEELLNYYTKEYLFGLLPKVSDTGTYITLNNTYTSSLKLNLGASELSQDATPTPSAPQDIHTISGSNTIKVEGSNLFGEDILQSGFLSTSGSYPTTNSSYPNAKYMLIPIKENQSVTFSNSTNTMGRVRYIDNDTNQIVASIGSASTSYYTMSGNLGSGFTDSTITALKDFTIGVLLLDGNFDSNLMINFGSTALPYEPYTSQEADIDLDTIEYCKIGNYEDKFIRSNDGTWQLEKNIGKVVLDGSENWGIFNSSSSRVAFRYLINDIEGYTSGSTIPNLMLNRFTPASYNATWASGMASRLTNVDVQNALILIYEPNTTVEDFKTWLSTHNTEVYYVLATPTYTQITGTLETQLENVYKNMLSQTGQTNISQENADLPFTITATSLKDISNL